MSSEAKKFDLKKKEQPLRDVSYNRRILVVEDEPEIADSYRRLLGKPLDQARLRRSSRSSRVMNPEPKVIEKEKFEIDIVHNAHDALLKLQDSIDRNQPYAMAFVDVLLGEGKDGIELVSEIFEYDMNIICVFVTAYQDRSVDSIHDLLGRENSNRWDYLNKPFSDGEILQKARSSISLWNTQREKELKELELAEARSRMLASERMVSVAAVSRGVGHEFGNILLHIMGRAELSRMGTEAEMKNGFDVILKACETASGILEKFNGLAKPNEDQSSIKPAPAMEPLDEALDLMSHQLINFDIRVNDMTEGDYYAEMSTNSLVQVFVNLIMNAVDAMGEGGRIDIKLIDDGEWVEYRVRDYGPGIPEHIIDHVTDAFFTTKGDHGTGLGLAICREIVEIEHGGEFIVKNHCEKGAEFVIRLPLIHHWEDSSEQ